MKLFHHTVFTSSQWGRVSRYVRALCWLIGLLLGFYSAGYAGSVMPRVVIESARGTVSILRLLAISVLPFLISFLAVQLNQKWLLLAVCFVKAFFFGFCATGIAYVFGSAGWLIRFLLLFSDCMTLPALILYDLFLADRKEHAGLIGFIFMIYAAAVGIADYFCIVPLLRGSIS